MNSIINVFVLTLGTFFISACTHAVKESKVSMTHGIDDSAGNDAAYIITTMLATYYLEKQGGGLSSIVDKDGVDWLGFHKQAGTGYKGEYRGFPNAIHKQDGNYFHAMNASTEVSTSEIDIVTDEHIRILFTSGNGMWQGQWDFYPERCDFTMKKVSDGYLYWIQYEGVPGGQMDDSDFWFASVDTQKHPINEHFIGDLPSPEWMAFGDEQSPRMLYMLHHQDDEHPDTYENRPDMTVFAFGRQQKNKYLNRPQKFSIGFIESVDYKEIEKSIQQTLNSK